MSTQGLRVSKRPPPKNKASLPNLRRVVVCSYTFNNRKTQVTARPSRGAQYAPHVCSRTVGAVWVQVTPEFSLPRLLQGSQ